MAKAKPKTVKVNKREMIHLDFLNVYNEVLKYNDVIDLDIDDILDVTKQILQEELSLNKMAVSPDAEVLSELAVKIVDRINEYKQSGRLPSVFLATPVGDLDIVLHTK